jgi:hypothetical protein
MRREVSKKSFLSLRIKPMPKKSLKHGNLLHDLMEGIPIPQELK